MLANACLVAASFVQSCPIFSLFLSLFLCIPWLVLVCSWGGQMSRADLMNTGTGYKWDLTNGNCGVIPVFHGWDRKCDGVARGCLGVWQGFAAHRETPALTVLEEPKQAVPLGQHVNSYFPTLSNRIFSSEHWRRFASSILLMIFPKSAPASSQCPTNMGWSLLVEGPACRSSTPEILSCRNSWEKIPIKLVRHT